jgi:hypothetical protein
MHAVPAARANYAALLTGAEFIGLARTVTEHFACGAFGLNAYRRLAMRNSGRLRGGPLSTPTVGEGIDDPREPESWNARLSLIEELSTARAPEVSFYAPLLRTVARISARAHASPRRRSCRNRISWSYRISR